MFYARGDDHFCLASVYDCPDNTNSILASVWGKRKDNDPNNVYSRVHNFNRLGGRNNCPPGVDMAYGYSSDLNRTFFAQFEILKHMEKDLCIGRKHWTVASKKEIEDQLYSLALVPESTGDLTANVVCGRDWSEVEDALVESHLAADNVIDHLEYVDLSIYVQVVPANKEAKPTIIEIQYNVNMRRDPADRGHWNVRASDTASGVIDSGIHHDTPEGGKTNSEDTSSVTNQYPNSPYHPPLHEHAADPPQQYPQYPQQHPQYPQQHPQYPQQHPQYPQQPYNYIMPPAPGFGPYHR